jgi:hypothetical protein
MTRMFIAIPALALLSACTSTDTVLRPEGVTSFAGNAIAANTAMQMVDPWQYGVQDTKLKTPAERKPAVQAAEGSAEATNSDPRTRQ